MARLIVLLLAALALAAYLRRRVGASEAPDYSPAEELRSKLAESRAGEEKNEAQEEPEGSLEGDLERRRREVHGRARGAIDDLT